MYVDEKCFIKTYGQRALNFQTECIGLINVYLSILNDDMSKSSRHIECSIRMANLTIFDSLGVIKKNYIIREIW